MKHVITSAPPNSIFIFQDPAGGTAPLIDDKKPAIWWSESSLVVGTLAFMDGVTTLTVSQSRSDAPPGPPTSQMSISCPSGDLQATTAYLEILVRLSSVSNPAHLSVWTNHATEPDDIFVLVL